MKETKNNSWLCEVQAPPELHESIEQFFNALSYKLRHADGWQAGYECGYEKAMAEIRGKKDGGRDLIYRIQAIHAFDDAGFCTHDYIVGTLKDLPSAQTEPIKVSVDREMTEEELKELKKKIADSPVVLLPSAQSEIIRCKDCRHLLLTGGNESTGEGIYTCNVWKRRTFKGDGFFSYAERKENG